MTFYDTEVPEDTLKSCFCGMHGDQVIQTLIRPGLGCISKINGDQIVFLKVEHDVLKNSLEFRYHIQDLGLDIEYILKLFQ